jgi:hypothetical protein
MSGSFKQFILEISPKKKRKKKKETHVAALTELLDHPISNPLERRN